GPRMGSNDIRRKHSAMARQRRRHRVVVVAFDRLPLFELAIAAEVFGLPRPELPVAWYDFSVVSIDRGPVRATGAVRVDARHDLGRVAAADTGIVPGWRGPAEAPPRRLPEAIR